MSNEYDTRMAELAKRLDAIEDDIRKLADNQIKLTEQIIKLLDQLGYPK